MSLILDEEPLEIFGGAWDAMGILFLNCWTQTSKQGKGCSFFQCLAECLFPLNNSPFVLTHLGLGKSARQQCISPMEPHTSLEKKAELYHWSRPFSARRSHPEALLRESGKKQAPDRKSGCYSVALLCIKKIPSQCRLEVWFFSVGPSPNMCASKKLKEQGQS